MFPKEEGFFFGRFPGIGVWYVLPVELRKVLYKSTGSLIVDVLLKTLVDTRAKGAFTFFRFTNFDLGANIGMGEKGLRRGICGTSGKLHLIPIHLHFKNFLVLFLAWESHP